MDWKIILLLQTGATLALVGLIWTVQCIQYPLFAKIGSEAFVDYHAGHSMRITWIVGPLMLLELVTALAMLVTRPPFTPPVAVWIGLALIAVVWLSTAFLQVPMHHVLSQGFDAEAYAFLVHSNWIRTIGWTLRGFLMMWILWSNLVPITSS